MAASLPHQDHPTVVHMLIDAARMAGPREALVSDDRRLTYTQYLRCVTGFAAELNRAGAAGQRVVLLLGNGIDICIAMFAAHLARAQVVPLNPSYTAAELTPILHDCDARIMIHEADNSARDARLANKLGIAHCISVGEGARRLTEWCDKECDLPVLPQPDELATLQFTGGTTGRARGANLTHRALAVNLYQREALVPTLPDHERILCVMPLFHCYAIHMCLHNMVACRGTLVIVSKYHPQTVLHSMATERITLFGGSPSLFTGLLQYPAFAQTDFSNLRITYSGSAPLAADLLRDWEEATGSLVIEGYGQSEAGPVISFNPIHGARKLASVGLPVPATDLQIVDIDTGQEILAPGCQGEIRVRGPQIMTGYRGQPRHTAQVLRDGWLYTGDVGERDQDGYLFIRGRAKEMLIVSGYNVYPREVEDVLAAHPAVREAAVVGKADAYRGELPVAFVVKDAATALHAGALEQFCRARLAEYKLPVEFRIVDALPKTSVGKLDRQRLQRQL